MNEAAAVNSGHKRTLRHKVLNLRDDGVSYCQPYWAEAETCQRIYNNENPHNMFDHMGEVQTLVRGRMLYPKVSEIVDKIHPRLDQGMPRAKYLPEDENLKREDAPLQFADVDTIQNWADMYTTADDEVSQHSVMAGWVLQTGNGVRKIRWNKHQDRLEAFALSPLRFIIDSCSRIDMLDARFCGQWDVQYRDFVELNYPDFIPPNTRLPQGWHHRDRQGLRVEELWIRKETAQDELGVDAKRMVRCVLVDDNIARMEHTPWAYPDFPYVAWRNFLRMTPNGKATEFWGVGIPKKLWRQQQVLDNSIAKLLIQIGNQASGQLVVPAGAFDDVNQLNSQDGFIFELAKNFRGSVQDIKEITPTQVAPALITFIEFMVSVMEQVSGITDVFTGSEPAGDLSGRAIAALQAAAFTQITALIRDMVEYRRRLARIKGAFIQQMAAFPLPYNQWRGGVNIKRPFPRSARNVSYRIEVHDTSLLPQTPAGRLQLAQILAQFGLTIEKFLELTGIDKSYGVEASDFQQLPPQGAGGAITPNENVLAGRTAQEV